VLWHNVWMLDERQLLLLREANQAYSDFGDRYLTLTRGQRFKLRMFLGFATLLRWCQLV